MTDLFDNMAEKKAERAKKDRFFFKCKHCRFVNHLGQMILTDDPERSWCDNCGKLTQLPTPKYLRERRVELRAEVDRALEVLKEHEKVMLVYRANLKTLAKREFDELT